MLFMKNILKRKQVIVNEIIAIVLFTISFCLSGCGGGSSDATTDSTTVTSDSTSYSPLDTSESPDEKPTQPLPLPSRSAILGYSYFSNMRQHETRSVYAYISINNPESVVISTVQDLTADENPVRTNDTVTINTYNLNMLLYKYVDVNLLQNDSDFIIREVHPIARQEIDSIYGNKWQWNITPKTTKEFTTLTLNVVAEKPNGSRDRFESRNISIDITIDKSINRTVWNWMMDNPGKTLTLVIIPLVAFFGRRYFGDKKAAPPDKKNKDED